MLASPNVRPEAPPQEIAPAAQGSFRLVMGSPDELDALESELVLDAVEGGADALLVCGGNRLDAYALLARARARGLRDEVADGVWLARAFTVHQFVALLEETLPLMARERGHVGVVLVTGFLEPFADEDLPPAEGRALLARSVRRLDAWSRQAGAPVLATSSPYGARGRELAQLAEETLGVQALAIGAPRSVAASRKLESFFPGGLA